MSLAVKKSSQEGDLKFPNPPSDSISSLAVNGNAQTPTNMVIATSWDNTVSCYELQMNPQTGQLTNVAMRGQIKHDAPVLCSTISSDNMTAFSGGCDGLLKMWNVTQGATAAQVVGKHDAPIRCCKFIPDKNMVLTGSWDKTVKAWDLRQPNPAATLPLTERIYAMDANNQAVVVATADKQMHIFDLNAGNKISEFKSPLSYQSRCVSLFYDGKGFVAGCTEGRICVEYFDELHHKPQMAQNPTYKPNTKNFAFKCHRDQTDVFGVNAIDFHPRNTFCSVGSDGVISFWDKDARHRLANLELFKHKSPITDIRYSPFGNMVFYACSYDWCRGAENNADLTPQLGAKSCLMAHTLQPVEYTPKEVKKK